MPAKEAERGLLWGWNLLHTVIDKSPDKPIADVALYVSSDNRYDDRQPAIIKAFKENGVAFSMVPLKEIEGVPEDVIGYSQREAIKIELPPAINKEEQIAGIQSTLRSFVGIGKKLKDEWTGTTISGMGDEDRIAAVVKAVEAAYQEQGTPKTIAPSRFQPKDSYIKEAASKEIKPPQVG